MEIKKIEKKFERTFCLSVGEITWLINRVKELETDLSLANSLLATQCDLARDAETRAMKAISDLEDFKILTNVWICAYCGRKFPKDAAMSPMSVADHATHCEKSPLVQKIKELEVNIKDPEWCCTEHKRILVKIAEKAEVELSRMKLEKIPLVEGD